mmetsp:Transcript_7589/g.13670  ORF Transcript_7589/g.13670 Transcript_7589/m.13670 type:complete len:284 (+) Transcript_7589:414-1265(+)
MSARRECAPILVRRLCRRRRAALLTASAAEAATRSPSCMPQGSSRRPPREMCPRDRCITCLTLWGSSRIPGKSRHRATGLGHPFARACRGPSRSPLSRGLALTSRPTRWRVSMTVGRRTASRRCSAPRSVDTPRSRRWSRRSMRWRCTARSPLPPTVTTCAALSASKPCQTRKTCRVRKSEPHRDLQKRISKTLPEREPTRRRTRWAGRHSRGKRTLLLRALEPLLVTAPRRFLSRTSTERSPAPETLPGPPPPMRTPALDDRTSARRRRHPPRDSVPPSDPA